MGAEATAIMEMVRAGVDQYFVYLIIAVSALLIWEILAAIRFQHQKSSSEKIEKKMVTEKVSEKEAEKEEKEEGKARKKDKRVFDFSVKEFVFLKELWKEVNDAAVGKDLLDKAGKKLRALKKEERLEKRMSRRIEALVNEGNRLAKEEPSKSGDVKKLLAGIQKGHESLMVLMAENGEFEKILNTAVNATMTKEQKKERLLAVLSQAVKYDEEMMAAAKQLGALTK